MKHFLMKSEPETFGLEHLAKAPGKTTGWDGVRNYQARNMLRDDMKKGDLAFLYHSSTAEPGIVAIMKIVRAGYPDPTAVDRKHHHFDPDSDRKAPRWFMVDVHLVRKLRRVITLTELRAHQERELRDMWLLRRGNRLSITPLTIEQWNFILSIE
jgi:predicted RNA-binding protein with PUA-like domain